MGIGHAPPAASPRGLSALTGDHLIGSWPSRSVQMATPSFSAKPPGTVTFPLPALPALCPACCHKRTLRLIGIHVDEADRNARKSLAALHADRIRQNAGAVGEMTAIAPRKSADDLDILYGIVVVVAQRERHQRLRAKAAAAPGLR